MNRQGHPTHCPHPRLHPLNPALQRCAALLLLAAWAGPAAALDVLVTTATGQPLADAVVFLESREARAAVKPAAGVEVAQQDKRFTPSITVVPVGTSVTFPNRDTVRHHVYSFSPVKKFEIKLYVGTPAAPVVFDQPGIAVLGCNIHDQMAAWVVIVDTPWYGRSGADGRVRLPQPPAGSYKLRVWHASLPVGDPASEQPLRVEPSQPPVQVKLAGARP